MHVSRWLGVAALTSACAAPAATENVTSTDVALQESGRKTSTDPRVNPHAAAIAEFKKRVDAYADLHKRLAKGDAKEILKDDAPAPGTVPFKVNAKYPENQPLPTVPANVLLSLPALPAPLEYRIVGQHLLLLDMEADLVVDYILNATAS